MALIAPSRECDFASPRGVEVAYRGGAGDRIVRAIEIVVGGKKVLGARQPSIASPSVAASSMRRPSRINQI